MKKHPLVLAIILLFAFQISQSARLFAQTTVDNKSTQLKSFVGKYQAENSKMTFIQIMLKGDHLVLKQLWDDEEIPFKQTSDLEFYNDEHSFPLKFTKNNAGEILKVLAFDRDTWIRVPDDYKFEPQKTIQLTAEQLKRFEGKYQLKDGDNFLQITAAKDHLILKQLWDQEEITFLPVSEVDFFNADQTFPLKFTKGSDGFATKVLAFNKDLWVKVK